MNYTAAILAVILAAGALHGAEPKPAPAARASASGEERKPEKEPSVKVIDKTAVLNWLASHFPDKSSAWPEQARKELASSIRAGYWDIAARGEFSRTGTPGALLIRLQPPVRSTSTLENDYAGCVAKLRLLEYYDGKWGTRAFLGGEIIVGEKKRAEKATPGNKGYWIDLEDDVDDSNDGAYRLRITGDLLTPGKIWAGEKVWYSAGGPERDSPKVGKLMENALFRIVYEDGGYHYLEHGDYIHPPFGPYE